MMRLRCANPQCLKEIEVPEKNVGGQVQCPHCGFAFLVPTSTEVEPKTDESLRREPDVATVVIDRKSAGLDPLIGRVLGGAKILRKLGEGGMGSAYLGRHEGLDIHVAVKILPEDIAKENPTFISRFRKEARAAARLDHLNVVKVMNVGEEHGIHFMVMEYVEGRTLKQYLEENRKADVRVAVDIVRQVLQALSAAHSLGILHRDVKPSNVFLKPVAGKGNAIVAKLGDFGLAKFEAVKDTTAGRFSPDLTGAVLGSPHYMSPEQAENPSGVDPRADLYSAGCMFYHVLTGELPFPGSTYIEIVYKHCTAELPDMRPHCPEAPAGLFDIIRKMVAKSPDDRFRSADEVLDALDRLEGVPDSTGAMVVQPKQPVPLPVPPQAVVAQPFYSPQTTTDMARCPNPKCRFPISEGSKWCEFCGAWILDKCPNCGAEAIPRRSYCRHCGTSLFLERDIVEQLNRCEALLKEKRYALAIGAANSLLQNDPASVQAKQIVSEAQEAMRAVDEFRAKATAAVRNGEPQQAMALLEKAKEIDPNDEQIKAELEAIPQYVTRRDAQTRIFEAEEARKTGSVTSALTLFKEALNADPTNQDALRGVRECQELLRELDDLQVSFLQYWEKGELDKAVASCERILEQNPGNCDARGHKEKLVAQIEKARQHTREAEQAEAGRQWEQALEHWREAHQCWRANETMKQSLDRAEKTVAEIQRLLAVARDRFDRKRLTSGLKRLRHVLSVGEAQEAQALLEKYGRQWKKAEDLKASGVDFTKGHLWRRALIDLQQAYDLNHQAVTESTVAEVRARAQRVEKYIRNTRELLDQGRFEEAVDYAEKGLQMGPDPELQELASEARQLQDKVRVLGERVKESAGNPRQSLQLLQELLKIQPFRKDLKREVAALRKKLGELDTALQPRDEHSESPTDMEDRAEPPADQGARPR
jgi:serine/threonine protein kinase